MKGPIRIAFTGAVLLIGSSAFAAPLTSLHIRFTETVAPAKAKPMTRTSEMWLKMNKMRIEQNNLTIISDGKKSYMFSSKDPQKRMQVTDIPTSQQNGNIAQMIGQMVTPMLKQMKKVGTDKVLGYPVDVYQAENPKMKAIKKTWVATTIGAPVFLKEETRSPQGSSLIHVTALQVNSAISDKQFSPPSGYKMVTTPPRTPVRPGAPPAKKR